MWDVPDDAGRWICLVNTSVTIVPAKQACADTGFETFIIGRKNISVDRQERYGVGTSLEAGASGEFLTSSLFLI